jgi:hypothetical protein
MIKAFIDGNIWEINLKPRHGVNYNYFTIKNIFYYNSLNDRTFERSNTTDDIQIPEKIILGLDLINYIDNDSIYYGYKSVKEFILGNKDIIIRNEYPIMKREIIGIEEKWSVDLNMLFYDKNKKWKNE